jgi:flagellar hook-length control protein FliK
MEAIVVIPAPSLTPAPGGQHQTNRTGGDQSFAPSLSHAIAGRNKNDGHSSEKPAAKTTPTRPEEKPEEKNPTGSDQPEKVTTRSDRHEKPSSSPEDPLTEKPPADTSSEIVTDSEAVGTDKVADPTVIFAGGLQGFLFSLKNDTPVSDMPKTIPALPDSLPSGQQDGRNILQNLTNFKKDALTFEQSKNPLPSDTTSPKILDALPGALPMVKQDGLNILHDTYGLQPNSQYTDAGNILKDQSGAFPNTGKDLMQTGAGTEHDTLIAQQLQKILSANGADMSTINQKPALQNQAFGLDTLSGPLFTITDTSTQSAQQATAIPGVATATVITALSKGPLPGDKITENSPSRLEDNHPGILTKPETHDQKDTLKSPGKDALLQDTADHRQTTLVTLTSSPDTAGSSPQAGQFSFGSALTQSLQTGQHATGTSGTNALPLWTPSQENGLVNQVMQNFQLNSNSPSSKLVLKLHPEELGELKIDIQMKDGAIKANIFTHSEQVQQVLEKYIPKLRSFMEQQGLTVDEILVTNTSDNVDGHNLFQEDFANNHDFSQPGKSTRSASFADLTFEKAFSKTTDAISGVNVTV